MADSPVVTGAPLIGVVSLQGGVSEHVAALQQCGARTRLVRRSEELGGLDGIVVPGGESSVLDKLSRAFGLAAPLKAAVAGGLPTLATCAGLLLLSDELTDAAPGQQTLQVLRVRARRNAFGRQLASFETSLAVKGVGEDVEAVFIRAPVIEQVGAGVEVIAQVDDRVVGVRQGAITALAFHPELTPDRRIHADFVSSVAAHLSLAA